MTLFRVISLPTHGLFELLGGLALVAAPFVIGFSPAGTLLAVVLGACVVGLALGAAETPRISAHLAADQAALTFAVASALALALMDDAVASVTFLLAALAHGALMAMTRYSRAPLHT